jgi:DNA-directed RNA polymerase subunit RPC12/RpoP
MKSEVKIEASDSGGIMNGLSEQRPGTPMMLDSIPEALGRGKDSLLLKNDAKESDMKLCQTEWNRCDEYEMQAFYPCPWPRCDAPPFTNQTQLSRHFTLHHTPGQADEDFSCDHRDCARKGKKYKRVCDYWEHLRGHHGESMGTIDKHDASLDGGLATKGWWRCLLCMQRVMIETDGYECSRCSGRMREVQMQLPKVPDRDGSESLMDVDVLPPSPEEPIQYTCLFPYCVSTRFSCQRDLSQHLEVFHTPSVTSKPSGETTAPGSRSADKAAPAPAPAPAPVPAPPPAFFCDHPKCLRATRSFSRLDHYRGHLRDFHKEDIEKSRHCKVDARWYATRRVTKSWWRCARCLRRVVVKTQGYECPECKTACSEFRQESRQAGDRKMCLS